MSDFEQQMSDLSRRVARLEARVVELARKLADMTYTLTPFIVRYQQDVLDYHSELVEVRRQIADARYLLGDRSARSANDTETALTRLLTPGAQQSVEAQYKRVWQSNGLPTTDELLQKMAPAQAPPELVEMYAQIVVRLHPDLADSGTERQRRRSMMQAVDIAYARRDRVTLNSVAEAQRDRRSLPLVVDQQAVEAARARAARLESLIVALEGQVFELEHGDVAKVLALSYRAHQNGHDLLGELSASLQAELAEAKSRLAELQEQL